jgi:hypothetical protein
MSVGPLSTEKDYAEVVEFFKVGCSALDVVRCLTTRDQDKDTSKYSLGLAQSLDSIRAKAAFIKVSDSGSVGLEVVLTDHDSGLRMTWRSGLQSSCLRQIVIEHLPRCRRRCRRCRCRRCRRRGHCEDLSLIEILNADTMPAFDPVRDAVLNSPVSQILLSPPLSSPSLGRRATDLSVLLNSDPQEPSLRTPPLRSSTLSHLLHSDHVNTEDDKLGASQPLTRSTVDAQFTLGSTKTMFTSSPSPTPESTNSRPPSPPSVSVSFPTQLQSNTPKFPPLPQSTIPYNPKVRMTTPTSVMIPLSPAEVKMYKDNRYRGRGATQIALGAKRKRSEEPPESEVDRPPTKKLAGDVGVVVNHCEFSPPTQIHDTDVSKITLARTWGSYSVLNHL